jgi:hypothetical protein
MSVISFTITANMGSYSKVEAEIDLPSTRKTLEKEIKEYNAAYLPLSKYNVAKRPCMVAGGSFDVVVGLAREVDDEDRTKETIKERFNSVNAGQFWGAQINDIDID